MRRRLVRQVKHAGIVKHGECDLITIVQQTIRATHTSASCRGKTPSTLHVQQLPNRSDVVCLPSTSTPLSTCPHLLSSPWPLTSRTPKPNQRRAAELLLGSPLDYAALRAQLSHTRKAFALLHTRQQHKSNGGMGGGGGGGGGGEVTGRGQGGRAHRPAALARVVQPTDLTQALPLLWGGDTCDVELEEFQQVSKTAAGCFVVFETWWSLVVRWSVRCDFPDFPVFVLFLHDSMQLPSGSDCCTCT